MSYLTVEPPEGDRYTFELDSSPVRIGRSRGNDLVLPDQAVSRDAHARIELDSDGCYRLHVDGEKPVYLNGTRLKGHARLDAGDLIRIGRTRMIFDRLSATPVNISDDSMYEGGATTAVSVEEFASGSGEGGGAAEQARRALEVVLEANEALVLHVRLEALFEKLLDLSHRVVPYERGVLMTLVDGELREGAVRILDQSKEAAQEITLSRTITQRVIHQKEAVLAKDALIDPDLNVGRSVTDQGIRSLMCVPLWDNRNVIGLLYVDNTREPGLFTEENLRLLTQLANIAAIKIENKRLLDEAAAAEFTRKELKRAADIQKHLLPSSAPEIPGYDAHGVSDPCFAVGGDYFDYLTCADGRCAVTVADVAGKGFPAAMIMSSLHSGVQLLSEFEREPLELCARLNRWLSRSLPGNRFVTCFYALLDRSTNTLSYVNAGHTSPLMVREGGETEELPVTGPPLGIIPVAKYKTGQIEFGPGDLLISYSDGVTEAENSDGEQFGEERLMKLLKEARAQPAAKVVEKIRKAVARHLGELPRQDDTTILVLKRAAG